MYPQTVVPSGDELHNTLTNGMDAPDSEVTFTGTYYTANKDGAAWNPDDNDPDYSQELNPVYEYQGKRYVRVTPYAYVKDSDNYKYNVTADNPNPERVDQCAWNDSSSQPDRLRWFKVEPIKWIVLNFNDVINSESIFNDEIDIITDFAGLKESSTYLELYAADVLMSGIQFNPESASQSIWNQSSIYKYLNSDFYNQAFSDDDKQQIQVSTIYNNTNSSDYNNPIYNLNANHLTDGSGMNYTDQYLYLLSRYELENSLSPYVSTNPIFVKYDEKTADESRIVTGTDYARAHNLRLSSNDVYGYWTRTANSGTSVYRVSYNGSVGSYTATSANYGTRPALTMFLFCFVGRFITGVISILGMYPQTVVPSDDELHTTLTNGSLGLNEDVKATGTHYTANKDAAGWNPDNRDNTEELNPVYEYQGKRYVRVTPYAYVKDSDNYKYNVTADNPNPERVDQFAWNDSSSQPDRLRWFKVEPIKWIIINYKEDDVTFVQSDEKRYGDMVTDSLNLHIVNKSATLELYAADVIMSGIQFNPESAIQSIWDQSSIYKYLNIDFYNQAFSDDEQIQIQTSTIYNNTSSSDYNNPAYNLNSNHLTDGSGMNPTNQNIYLLSYYELSNNGSPYVTANPIFTSDETRKEGGTDYARAHYLRLSSNNVYGYWTRTASSGTSVYRVYHSGSIGSSTATSADYGTRPALTMVCFALLKH